MRFCYIIRKESLLLASYACFHLLRYMLIVVYKLSTVILFQEWKRITLLCH